MQEELHHKHSPDEPCTCQNENGETVHCKRDEQTGKCNCKECDLEKEIEDTEEEEYVGHFHDHAPHSKKTKDTHNKEDDVDQEILSYYEMAQRMKADFDNYKRRTEQEMKQSYQSGISFAVEQLLNVVDSVAQAKNKVTDENTLKGLDLIEKQCFNSFAKLGVQKIECVGKEFDPHLHNAVMTVADNTKPDGVVVEELQQGFMFEHKVIRHSVVSINKL